MPTRFSQHAVPPSPPTGEAAGDAVDTTPTGRLDWQAGQVAAVPVGVSAAIGVWVLAWGLSLPADAIVPLVLFAVLLTGVATAVAVGWSRWLADKVAATTRQLRRLQDGDYDARAPECGCAEIGELARQANRLAQRIVQREQAIGAHALHDPLTGLPNRTLLTDRLSHAIRTSERRRDSFCVLVIDLDGFKLINDSLGHAVGDQMLVEVAERLRRSVRDSDTVARLGGDEFVLLLQGTRSMAEEVALRILEVLREPMTLVDQVVSTDASIGIAVFPDHGERDATLIRHADAAMYRAKRRHSGFEVFDGDERALRRSSVSVLGELSRALAENQFELHVQPCLDLRSGRITGVEGLLRWNHPTRGQLPPGEFIAFAEQTGFLRNISLWVIREGLDLVHRLSRAGLPSRVAINITAGDLLDRRFAGHLASLLRATPIPDGTLCLEISERGILGESPVARETLDSIAQLGIACSIDDFGTGGSTLEQLQLLPITELKIDRGFVVAMLENPASEAIVRSTIDMAHQLGLRVVAEGVESQRQMRALIAAGCDAMQGYHLAKPMPVAELESWIRMHEALHPATNREAGDEARLNTP